MDNSEKKHHHHPVQESVQETLKRERLERAKKVLDSQPIPRNIGESDEEYVNRYYWERTTWAIREADEARAAARRKPTEYNIKGLFKSISILAVAVVLIVFTGLGISRSCDDWKIAEIDPLDNREPEMPWQLY